MRKDDHWEGPLSHGGRLPTPTIRVAGTTFGCLLEKGTINRPLRGICHIGLRDPHFRLPILGRVPSLDNEATIQDEGTMAHEVLTI
jgi:hypothetical protein